MMNAADRNTIELEVLLGNAGYGARDTLGRWLSDGCATPIEARYVAEGNALKLATFVPGARVRTTRDLERYPHFIVEAGALGTVVDHGDPTLFAVRLDEEVPGAEDWENEVHWSNGDSPHDDLELACTCTYAAYARYAGGTGTDIAKYDPSCPEHGETPHELDEDRRRLGDVPVADVDAALAWRAGVPADPHLERALDGRSAAFSRTDDDVEPDESFVSDERDEQDAAYERVSFPKVELDPADARFVVESLEYLAGVDEGEHTDRERLLELAGRLDTAQAIARAGALGVELAFSLSGEPVFDVGFVNLMLDELEALPAAERPAAVRAVNDGSSPADRRAYEEGRP